MHLDNLCVKIILGNHENMKKYDATKNGKTGGRGRALQGWKFLPYIFITFMH